MLEKLCAIEARFDEISQSLCDSRVVNDREKYSALMKEHKTLLPIVEKFREYKKIEKITKAFAGGIKASSPIPQTIIIPPILYIFSAENL